MRSPSIKITPENLRTFLSNTKSLLGFPKSILKEKGLQTLCKRVLSGEIRIIEFYWFSIFRDTFKFDEYEELDFSIESPYKDWHMDFIHALTTLANDRFDKKSYMEGVV